MVPCHYLNRCWLFPNCIFCVIITWLAWLSLWRFQQRMESHAWICTMHGNLKKVPKLSYSYILQSQWWNFESGIVTEFLSYLIHTTQLSKKLFLKMPSRIRIWNMINFIEIINKTLQSISHLHIFVSIFCVDLVTQHSLWRHKGVAMRVAYKTMHRFPAIYNSPSPASELRLQISAFCKMKTK